jgi:hypothetical protein
MIHDTHRNASYSVLRNEAKSGHRYHEKPNKANLNISLIFMGDGNYETKPF